MPNTSVLMQTSQILDEVGLHKTACEQFALLYFSNMQAGLIQRDQRLAEFETEIVEVQNERDNAVARRAEAEAELALANVTIANLQERIAELNAAIDAAQAAA